MQPAEKRKSPRRSITYPAFLDLGGGSSPRECTLCDASQEGAQLLVADPNSLPNEFILALSSDGAARRCCRVIWRTETAVGVEFLKDVKKPSRPSRSWMQAMRASVPGAAEAVEGMKAPAESADHQVDLDTLATR